MEQKVSGPQAAAAENRDGTDHEKEVSLGEVLVRLSKTPLRSIQTPYNDVTFTECAVRRLLSLSRQNLDMFAQRQVFIELNGGTMLTENLNTKLRRISVLSSKRLIQELTKRLQKNGTSSTKKVEKCTVSYGKKGRPLKLPKHLIHGYLQLAKV